MHAADLIQPQSMALTLGVVALILLVGILAWDTPGARGRPLLLLIGILVLPGLALLFGAGAALRAAERPEFCGSCHVMTPFLNDLRNPDSTNLAAVHYQNRFIRQDQCYTCHTDYTMFGPLESKLAGMRHLWNYTVGTYAVPIKIRGTYNIGNCLNCHGESKRYREKHESFLEDIAAGTTTCLDCHAPVHPEQRAQARR